MPKVDVAPAEQASARKYVPKDFSEARLAFIRKERENGMKFREANDAWMASNERASYLAGMSISELKKRRFL